MNPKLSSNKREFEKSKRIYVSVISLYELADKLFGAIYIAFMRAQGIPIDQVSSLFSIQQILQAFFDYPTGTLSDKIGRKKITGCGLIVWGSGILVYAFAENFCTFLPSMVLMAFGMALISGAPSAWLIDQMIKYDVYGERNRILPKIQSSISFFAVMASIISYFLIGIEQKIPIIVAGCISIISGCIALFCGEENYGKIKGENILYILHTQAKEFFRQKKLLLLALRIIVCHIPFLAFVLFWQVYATEIVKIKIEYLSFFLLFFMILLMFGTYMVSICTKKMSSFKTSIMGILVSILGFMILYAFQTVPTFLIGAGLVESGLGIEQAATSIWMCDYIKSEVRSTYSSIFSTIQAIGGFVIANLLGILTEKFGVNVSWVIASIVMGLDIIILIVFNSKYRYGKEVS